MLQIYLEYYSIKVVKKLYENEYDVYSDLVEFEKYYQELNTGDMKASLNSLERRAYGILGDVDNYIQALVTIIKVFNTFEVQHNRYVLLHLLYLDYCKKYKSVL